MPSINTFDYSQQTSLDNNDYIEIYTWQLEMQVFSK
jgi:hypothetical protein